ncbi:MAG: GNAT family N-acetyltransferase [Candidatus Pacebacteria bacterium]|nr:GNAT family N-acetyltransferase [Candidatus Paceibacterota bacterium]
MKTKTDANHSDAIVTSIDTDNHVVFLRGYKTTLRPPAESDIPLLMRWINDPDVRRNLGTQMPKTEADEREFVLNRSKSNVILIIEVDGKPIGTMGLHNIRYPDATATTGAMIGEKSYWGKGYGTDAKMALLDYAFSTLGLRRVKSEAMVFNKRSLAYSMHCGYVVEGVKKKEVFRGGKYHDLVLLAVTPKTWRPYFKKWKKDSRLKSDGAVRRKQ